MRLCSCATHVLVRWMRSCSRRSRIHLPRRLQEPLSYIRLIFNSVCHNSLLNCDLVTDSLFEPVFWMVEIITRWFGIVSRSLYLMFPNFIAFTYWFIIFQITFCHLYIYFFIPFLKGLCVSSNSSHQLRPLGRVFLNSPLGD